METDFIEITNENIDHEHLCCIIRSKAAHPGVETKRQWLKDRLDEGHVFRKLNSKDCVFIEYAPLEKAWVPITGENYMYIYCLWVQGAPKGHGYGRELIQHCIDDARRQGRSGVCMIGADKQKSWLSDQNFAKKFGFVTADRTSNGYVLLALSFDGTLPRFTDDARTCKTNATGLVIYYDYQCPFTLQRVETLRKYCEEKGIEASFILVDSLERAKALPCIFNNWAVFYDGDFITVNQIDGTMLEKIIAKARK